MTINEMGAVVDLRDLSGGVGRNRAAKPLGYSHVFTTLSPTTNSSGHTLVTEKSMYVCVCVQGSGIGHLPEPFPAC